MRRAKLGVVFLASGWFYSVGMQNQKLAARLEDTEDEIVTELSKYMDVVDRRQVHSLPQAKQAAAELNNCEIDCVLICQLTWVEDQILLPILDTLKPLPLAFWCYNPDKSLPDTYSIEDMLLASGGVGILQCSGLLKQRGISAEFVFGTHKQGDLFQQVMEFANCAMIKKTIRDLRVGLLPYRCGLMSATWVDEFVLGAQLGPTIQYISVDEYANVIRAVTESDIQVWFKIIKSQYYVSPVINDKCLSASIRASLAIDKLSIQYGLEAIAIDDLSQELHNKLGLRPGIRLPGMWKNNGLAVSMEGDVCAAVMMWITTQLTGKNSFYGEPLTYDIEKNVMVIGHAGLTDAGFAAGNKIRILPDYEYQNSDDFPGAMNHYIGRGGPVTAINCVYNGQNIQVTAFEAEAIDTERMLPEGYSHVVIRPAIRLQKIYRDLFHAGVSQHFAVTYSKSAAIIELLGRILDVKTNILI